MVRLHEKLGDLLFGFVYRRRDDMRWRLVGQLQNIFAEVGFHHADAGANQRVVKRDFFGDHRLGFGHRFHVIFARNFKHDCVRFFRRFRPVD